MFLRSLRLTNVRGHRDLVLPVTRRAGDPDHPLTESRRWTLILGENGTGKSTILRAIALVMAGSNALTDLLHAPDEWIHVDADEARFVAEFATSEGEPRSAELVLRRGAGIGEVIKENAEGLRELDAALAHSSRSYLVMGYGVSRRSSSTKRVSREASPFSDPRARSVATLFTPEARLTSIEDWAMDMEYRNGEAGLEAIKSAFLKLIPDVTFHGIERKRRQLLFKTPDGLIPFELLSDGYQTIVTWIGDLLHRLTEIFEDYKQPLDARGLLILDELELHLHPLWQRELVGFISQRLPNFQIVATTHAPLAAHQADEGELFTIRREEPLGPPRLTAYEGAPRRLMIHQLLQTPAFGLETLDSAHTEDQRKELAALKDAKSREAQERAAELSKKLAELPNWKTLSPDERRHHELMSRIDARLQRLDDGPDAGPAGPKAAKKKKTAKKKTAKRKTAKRKTAKKKTAKKKTAKKTAKKKTAKKKASQ